MKKKIHTRFRSKSEQRQLNQEKYWLDFYRARYWAKMAGALLMLVIMAVVSVLTRSMMPLYIVTPILVVGCVLLTGLWRKRIGL